MNAHICNIGVIDHKGKSHYVSLLPGVNVITGRSSTGKSALIEIFDYCFAASEFTVPAGVITANAAYYFTTIQINQGYLTLVRTEKLKKQGLILQSADEAAVNPENFNLNTFADSEAFTGLRDYKKRLGRIMGLIITDVEEDLNDREFRHNKARKGTPSIRSFTSFMLQHQNLIANKHALFYRFDEKEKRDQVIGHFMIFLGLVDGDYYQLQQDLNEKIRQLQSLTRFSLPQAQFANDNARRLVRFELDKYLSASGRALAIGDWESSPAEAIKMVNGIEVELDSLSAEHVEIRNRLEQSRSALIGERREIERRLSLISGTKNQILDYKNKAQHVPTPAEGRDGMSYCPFCLTTHSALDAHANKLNRAIDWLNGELRMLRTLPLSLSEDQSVSERALEANTANLGVVIARIGVLDAQLEGFKQKRSHLEIAIAAKIGVASALTTMNENPVTAIELKIKRLEQEIDDLKSTIKKRYDLVDHTHRVEKRIRELMKEIGSGFEFEASYRPINLHFSAETFELWHKVSDREKVFLRSMGSGANWLSCHLTLFLAMHRYFCELKNCVIPPVLFLDQPSQVYFPAVLDTDEKFSAESIAAKEGPTRQRLVDDDIKAVTNVFSKLVSFCTKTKEETGIEPQIIVTDHADDLTLDGEIQFKDLVRAKWRGPNDGLIRLEPVGDLEGPVKAEEL